MTIRFYSLFIFVLFDSVLHRCQYSIVFRIDSKPINCVNYRRIFMNDKMSSNGNKVNFFTNPELVVKVLGSIGSILREPIPISSPGSVKRRKLFVMRHGERMDLVFGSFVPYSFDEAGNYSRKDLNMPSSLPPRKNINNWKNDAPLTNIGVFQCELIGKGMKTNDETVERAYCSPMFRCVQSCAAVLRGLGVEDKVKICVEPGLFEFRSFYPDGLPTFYTPQELKEIGYNIDTKYVPILTVESLDALEEDYESFYLRNSKITESIIKDPNTGNLLFVAHGSNLDTNTRLIIGKEMRSATDIGQMMHNVGFASLVCIEEKESQKWELVAPPLSQLTHSSNSQFDWRMFQE